MRRDYLGPPTDKMHDFLSLLNLPRLLIIHVCLLPGVYHAGKPSNSTFVAGFRRGNCRRIPHSDGGDTVFISQTLELASAIKTCFYFQLLLCTIVLSCCTWLISG